MSDYYPTAHLVAGRPLWRVCRRASTLTGCGPTVVWSGINKESCRRALLEFREVERYNTAHWPTNPMSAAYGVPPLKLRKALRDALARPADTGTT